ncbi:MAG: hypothetical protein GXP52_08045 [Deltaproteobacteria bacterium]|nr:hypothetical protein [Deltaproteobacteria bacterium]
MQESAGTITKFPGNDWLEDKLRVTTPERTIAFIHGVIRGAAANPLAITQEKILGEALGDVDVRNLPQTDREELKLGLLHLLRAVLGSIQSQDFFPEAVNPDSHAEPDDFRVLENAAALSEGFLKGFRLRRPPTGVRLTNANSWLRDVKKEGEWCRMMAGDSILWTRTFPDAPSRSQVAWDALSWIEECMGWVALYARMDLN